MILFLPFVGEIASCFVSLTFGNDFAFKFFMLIIVNNAFIKRGGLENKFWTFLYLISDISCALFPLQS